MREHLRLRLVAHVQCRSHAKVGAGCPSLGGQRKALAAGKD